MLQTLKNAFKNKEVRTKIFITLALLFVYRLGCWLPVPGIDVSIFSANTSDSTSLFGLLSAITGNALSNGAFLAIGISPYINASIIIQLLTVAIPALERLSKQGDEGRKKLTQITRYFTLFLALAQAIGIVVSMSGSLDTGIFGNINVPEWVVGMFVVIALSGGAMFTMWLGELITDTGVGNGISLLIFVGILSTAGQSIRATIVGISSDSNNIWYLIGFLALVIVIFTLIIVVDLAERRIPIQYAKQIKGRKQYGGQSTNIPIKLNASGVLPIIFATALITFPQMIAQMVAPTSGFYAWYTRWLGTGTWIYSILVALLILFFSYFYAQIQFNPDDVARNIQQYGGFIPGIRPGRPTADYLRKVSNRLTLFGAIYLAFLAVVPSVIFSLLFSGNASMLLNAFTATGMMIVVSVAIEFDKQLEAQLMMKHYKGFLK